jgi:hypothetical protein
MMSGSAASNMYEYASCPSSVSMAERSNRAHTARTFVTATMTRPVLDQYCDTHGDSSTLGRSRKPPGGTALPPSRRGPNSRRSVGKRRIQWFRERDAVAVGILHHQRADAFVRRSGRRIDADSA